MGTGMEPSKAFIVGIPDLATAPGVKSVTGMETKTPHSQFLQFNLGSFVTRSFTIRPLLIGRLAGCLRWYYFATVAFEGGNCWVNIENTYQALSERFALPTYAHAIGRGFS